MIDIIIFRLGAKSFGGSPFKWIDLNPMGYTGWPPGQTPSENDIREEETCVSLQWTPSTGPLLPSGLYWKTQRCDSIGKTFSHNNFILYNLNPIVKLSFILVKNNLCIIWNAFDHIELR